MCCLNLSDLSRLRNFIVLILFGMFMWILKFLGISKYFFDKIVYVCLLIRCWVLLKEFVLMNVIRKY